MKKFLYFVMVVCAVAVFAACSNDENDNGGNGTGYVLGTIEGDTFASEHFCA